MLIAFLSKTHKSSLRQAGAAVLHSRGGTGSSDNLPCGLGACSRVFSWREPISPLRFVSSLSKCWRGRAPKAAPRGSRDVFWKAAWVVGDESVNSQIRKGLMTEIPHPTVLSKAPEVKTRSGAICSSNLLFWALHLTCGQSLLGVT